MDVVHQRDRARQAGAATEVGHAAYDGASLIARLVEIMNDRDVDALDELFTHDFEDHDPLQDQPPGVDGLRLGLLNLAAQGADVRFHLEDCFASGDRVAYRIFGTWTVPPEFTFQDALGPRSTVSLAGVGIYRCSEGRLAERWGAWVTHADGHVVDVRARREGEA